MSLFGTFGAGDIGSIVRVPFKDLGGPTGLLTQIITLALVAAGVFFFVYFLVGGIQWLVSGGDKNSLESARSRIYNALIGLVIIVGTFAIVKIIEAIFNISILSGFTVVAPS